MPPPTAPPIEEPNSVAFYESDYLKEPSAALAEVACGQRVELLAADGSSRVVIYPGSIADVPDAE
jgi:hypothetical protein